MDESSVTTASSRSTNSKNAYSAPTAAMASRSLAARRSGRLRIASKRVVAEEDEQQRRFLIRAKQRPEHGDRRVAAPDDAPPAVLPHRQQHGRRQDRARVQRQRYDPAKAQKHDAKRREHPAERQLFCSAFHDIGSFPAYILKIL